MNPTSLPFEYPFQWDNESLREGAGVSPEGAAILKQRDRDLEDYLATLGGGGKPYATVVVAASDSIAADRARADYVCSGAADQTEINSAFRELSNSALGTGRVLLLEGTFHLTSNVQMGWRSTLQGQGRGTALQAAGAIIGVAMDEDALLLDLHVSGSDASGSVGVYTGGNHPVKVHRVGVDGCQIGVQAPSGGGQHEIVSCALGATTAGSPLSVDIGASPAVRDDTRIEQCSLSHGLRVFGARNLVLGNRFASGATINVVGGSDNCFAHNFLPGGLASFTDAGTTTQRGANFANGGKW